MKTIQRTYFPGSEWLFIKIYIGYKASDDILTKEISSIINHVQKKQMIKKWFFIRYNDPDFHLRIRLLLTNELYTQEILSIFNKKLHSWNIRKLLWKIQIDTYTRELERYGISSIEESESIFYIDSICVMAILKNIISKNENLRWMIALKMIDELLSDFSLDIVSKLKLITEISESLKKEFCFNIYNSKQFNLKYREHKRTIEQILNCDSFDTDFSILCNIVRNKSKKNKIIIVQLKEKLKLKNTTITIPSLIISYIHMMLNRLFCAKPRIHELVLYDFMRRYYTSKLAITKYNKQ